MRIEDADITAEERETFERWLCDNDQHAREFLRQGATSKRLREMPPAMRARFLEDDRAENRRNILKFATFAVSAALAIVLGGIYLESRAFFGETLTTGTGEMRTVTFNEGSVAYLNTRTELRWRDSSDQRRVELVAGEALFDVAHDEKRPFSVTLDGSEIRVLGTRFNVYRKNSGDVVVTVLEGKVEIRGPQDAGHPGWIRRLSANEQIEYRRIGLVGEPTRTDPLIAVKWRSGLLEIPEEGAPLPEVLNELTRYTDQRILIKDPRVSELRVSGAFSTRDVRVALKRLTKVVPIEVRQGDGAMTIEYREAAAPGDGGGDDRP
jgi:transmembrane sensor